MADFAERRPNVFVGIKGAHKNLADVVENFADSFADKLFPLP